MKNKSERKFIITTGILNMIFTIAIGLVTHFMKDLEWWKVILTLIAVLVVSFAVNTFNLIWYVKHK